MIVSFDIFGIVVTLSSRDENDNSAIEIINKELWAFQKKDISREADVTIIFERLSSAPLDPGSLAGEIDNIGWKIYGRQSPYWYTSPLQRTWIREERAENKIQIKIFSNEVAEIIYCGVQLIKSAALDLLVESDYSLWTINDISYLIKDDGAYIFNPKSPAELAVIPEKDLATKAPKLFKENYLNPDLPWALFSKSSRFDRHPLAEFFKLLT